PDIRQRLEIGDSNLQSLISNFHLCTEELALLEAALADDPPATLQNIEVSRVNAEMVPTDYIRKQTLVNAERYITPELKEYETLVLNAEERILEIETRLFKELCAQIAAQAHRLLAAARALAHLDVFASLAEVAARNNYVRPTLVSDGMLEIHNGRHPVVEQFLPAGERFVPNDII